MNDQIESLAAQDFLCFFRILRVVRRFRLTRECSSAKGTWRTTHGGQCDAAIT